MGEKILEHWASTIRRSLPELVDKACCLLELLLLADLVCFGLVCQGLRSSVPYVVRAESLALLEREMSDEEVSLAEKSFSLPNSSGYRRFEGHPDQLGPFSRLSRAFAKAARAQGSSALLPGIARAHMELDSLGLTAPFIRDAYVSRTLRELIKLIMLHAVFRSRQTIHALLCHVRGDAPA